MEAFHILEINLRLIIGSKISNGLNEPDLHGTLLLVGQ